MVMFAGLFQYLTLRWSILCLIVVAYNLVWLEELDLRSLVDLGMSLFSVVSIESASGSPPLTVEFSGSCGGELSCGGEGFL